ncbi:MAG TPA: hypothetical protein VNN76_05150 [Bacteroidota bacterium]|nr:hypothetical protein [Bacteroidota bacterium]
MFIGHFAVALAAKKAAPKVSLGTLFISVQLVDLLWPVFLLLGLEHVRIDPASTLMTPLDFYNYPYTHSLIGGIVWSVALGLGYFLLRKDQRSALIVGAGVFTHWILDLITHRPDLPLYPGSEIYLGFGLWNSMAGTLIVEVSLFAAGILVYEHATSAKDRIGRMAFYSLLLFLGLVWTSSLFGPPPPSEQAVAIVGLSLWLLVAWGYWIDRHRQPVSL